MPKAPLLVLTPPARKTEARTFTDPAHPDHPITFTLRALDPYDTLRAADEARLFERAYAANGFPMPSGEVVRITPSIARDLANIWVMQQGPDEDRYTREELIGLMMNTPTAFMDIYEWVVELNRGAEAEQDPGNSETALTPPS